MNRTGWLALLLGGLFAGGVLMALRWPRPADPGLCSPSELRSFSRDGYVYVACAPDGGGDSLTPSAKWTVGLKVKLNGVSERELTELPGVGSSLARALVAARNERGGFKSWEEVDAVAGVGPAKLKMLQSVLEL